ncbi:iron ABC transporter permease [Catalinimonas niigatensis]|uniref:iron ABC transporter permease n=1 Tax=Catalinimonas niigatensis TaxID=1397264 RepID=UPI0026661E88|nr:iron ABC transporter permease [Catalinimonas niigatensis]WPP52692.1 iron ABC transporter permease [Catalinimonas niigatensis]
MPATLEHIPETAAVGKKNYALVLLGLALVMLFLWLADIALGSVAIPLSDVVHKLLGQPLENPAFENIILKIRLPKAITAVLAGAALAVGGLQMQTLFRNPLAGPSVLGVTSGASLGVALVTLSSGQVTTIYAIQQLGISSSWLVAIAASLGAALVLFIVLGISYRINDYVVLLIAGIMIGNITLSLVSLWQYFSNPEQIQNYLLWTFGSLHGVTQQHLWVLCISVALGLLLTFLLSKPLNALLLGEHYAQSLGVNIKQLRIGVIIATSLLAGAVTAFCGPIGFIGIAVPHLSRGLFHTANHSILIPASALIGAITLLGCDLIAQVPGSAITLPLNAITALIGSPVVIYVILKNRKQQSAFH